MKPLKQSLIAITIFALSMIIVFVVFVVINTTFFYFIPPAFICEIKDCDEMWRNYNIRNFMVFSAYSYLLIYLTSIYDWKTSEIHALAFLIVLGMVITGVFFVIAGQEKTIWGIMASKNALSICNLCASFTIGMGVFDTLFNILIQEK